MEEVVDRAFEGEAVSIFVPLGRWTRPDSVVGIPSDLLVLTVHTLLAQWQAKGMQHNCRLMLSCVGVTCDTATDLVLASQLLACDPTMTAAEAADMATTPVAGPWRAASVRQHVSDVIEATDAFRRAEDVRTGMPKMRQLCMHTVIQLTVDFTSGTVMETIDGTGACVRLVGLAGVTQTHLTAALEFESREPASLQLWLDPEESCENGCSYSVGTPEGLCDRVWTVFRHLFHDSTFIVVLQYYGLAVDNRWRLQEILKFVPPAYKVEARVAMTSAQLKEAKAEVNHLKMLLAANSMRRGTDYTGSEYGGSDSMPRVAVIPTLRNSQPADRFVPYQDVDGNWIRRDMDDEDASYEGDPNRSRSLRERRRDRRDREYNRSMSTSDAAVNERLQAVFSELDATKQQLGYMAKLLENQEEGPGALPIMLPHPPLRRVDADGNPMSDEEEEEDYDNPHDYEGRWDVELSMPPRHSQHDPRRGVKLRRRSRRVSVTGRPTPAPAPLPEPDWAKVQLAHAENAKPLTVPEEDEEEEEEDDEIVYEEPKPQPTRPDAQKPAPTAWPILKNPRAMLRPVRVGPLAVKGPEEREKPKTPSWATASTESTPRVEDKSEFKHDTIPVSPTAAPNPVPETPSAEQTIASPHSPVVSTPSSPQATPSVRPSPTVTIPTPTDKDSSVPSSPPTDSNASSPEPPTSSPSPPPMPDNDATTPTKAKVVTPTATNSPRAIKV